MNPLLVPLISSSIYSTSIDLKSKEVLTNVIIQMICITMINRKRKVHRHHINAPIPLSSICFPFSLLRSLSSFSSLEGTHKTVADLCGGWLRYVERTHLFKRISRNCYLKIINQVSGWWDIVEVFHFFQLHSVSFLHRLLWWQVIN